MGLQFFFVGRLIETKGIKVLVRMLNKLTNKVTVVVAGDGPLREYVQDSAKRYKNLTYLGRVENDHLPGYYSAADLLIVPSTVDEGWGFVAMEAISCGTPVVASQKGGLSDVVSSSVGKLVPANPDGFSKAIEIFIKDSNGLKKMSRNCRRYAIKNFGEDNVKDIIKHY